MTTTHISRRQRAVQQRLAKAKREFSAAAAAALFNEPGAAERCNKALRAVNAAMEAMRTLDAAERVKA